MDEAIESAANSRWMHVQNTHAAVNYSDSLVLKLTGIRGDGTFTAGSTVAVGDCSGD